MAEAYASSVIGAPAARVWERIRDFNALTRLAPRDRGEPDRGRRPRPTRWAACARSASPTAGSSASGLLALSDYDFSVTYSILESPMEVENYVATLKLTPVTDGDRTFAEWSAEFDCPPEREDELVALIAGGRVPGRLRRARAGARLVAGQRPGDRKPDGPRPPHHRPRRTDRRGVADPARLQRPRPLASHRRAERPRGRTAHRPGRGGAQLHDPERRARAGGPAHPLGPGAAPSLRHRGQRSAAPRLRCRALPEAGDRRESDVLVVELPVPDASRRRGDPGPARRRGGLRGGIRRRAGRARTSRRPGLASAAGAAARDRGDERGRGAPSEPPRLPALTSGDRPAHGPGARRAPSRARRW